MADLSNNETAKLTQQIQSSNVKLLEDKQIKHVINLRNIIMRQTDYDSEKALDKIKEFNGDMIAIIREYMSEGVTKTLEDEAPKSTNQIIMSEIRNMMDDASLKYRYKKDLEEKRKLILEKLMLEKTKEVLHS